MSADAAARRRIAGELGTTMLVEAGAGTGKTRALVDRVVGLVAAEVPIERVAAITFTERAAAELRERVRTGLDERVADPASPPEVAARCARARDDLDRAPLSTIHAFGQSLLRALAAEVGVDPEMTVLDQLAADRRFDERWRAALESLGPQTADGRAIDAALALGMRAGDLTDLARALTERADIAARIAADPPRAEAPRWEVLPELRALLTALPLAEVTDGEDRLLEHILALEAPLARAAAGDEWSRIAEVTALAGICDRGVTRLGNGGNWHGAIEDARVAVRAVQDGVVALVRAARAHATAALLPWVARVVLDDADARRREGRLRFTDLILWTRDLLRDDAAARAAVRRRFDALLIDEFQDTDPWQAEIALAFASGGGGVLDPGRLFLVGDPKQSIYRFRRADMAVYAAERARVAASGGALPELTVNRRSRRVVIDWVNAVVGAVIAEERDPTIGPPYVPIVPERDVALRGPGVAWMGGPSEERAQRIRMDEAADVAATCRAALDDGWEVEERDGTVRPAQRRDIAILLPTRTGLTTMEGALRRAGVPYRVEGGSLVFRTQELRDLINALTAIDDPSDEVAVVGALRSPAFACSDVELAEHRRAGLRFNYLAPALDGAEGPVAESLRALRAHHLARHDRSLAATVEAFVTGRRVVEIGLVDAGTRDAYRRARFVIEQARAFEADRPRGLRSFVAWLEERTAAPVVERDGAGLDDDEDAVRILTIHAAKGLEFPIVILAGIGTRPPYAAAPQASVDPQGRVVVAVGVKAARFGIGDVDGATAREVEHQKAEGARLLYVGATRARDHLVVSLATSRRYGGGSGAQRLTAAGACEAAPEWTPPPVAAAPATGAFAELRVDPAESDPARHDAARAALVDRSRRVRHTSATGIAAAEPRERGESAGDEPWARGRGGTRVGRAVHAAIQSLPLAATPDEVAAVAAAQAVAEAVPVRAPEIAALVASALASEAADRARAAGRTLREVPFALTLDDGAIVVEGFVDLVIDGPAGLEIVDWKTDDVTGAGVPERLEGYRIQAGLYAAGLTAATGRPVARITYVFVRPGIEVSPGEPAALAEAALAAAATV